MKKYQLTKQGYDNLRKEYEELKTIKRTQAVKRLQTARSMGDLSENSEYTAAKEGLAFVEGRIQLCFLPVVDLDECLRWRKRYLRHTYSYQLS